MQLKEDSPTPIENIQPGSSKTTMRNNFIIPKIVAAPDKCLLSMRDSVFILEATIEALANNADEFPINVVTVHWDGKLLPALDARKSKKNVFQELFYM
ncbi:hypothetical protein J437_LFUL005918 [Ladona fulva]|uniref:Uncharacterized protein n=1 Tax=Ladona fulva TaxID=123851 RepID=A0A8K0P544_LADFU|nr:hypothetical protein J437_LFUL005918 [Ladona fulva]